MYSSYDFECHYKFIITESYYARLPYWSRRHKDLPIGRIDLNYSLYGADEVFIFGISFLEYLEENKCISTILKYTFLSYMDIREKIENGEDGNGLLRVFNPQPIWWMFTQKHIFNVKTHEVN